MFALISRMEFTERFLLPTTEERSTSQLADRNKLDFRHKCRTFSFQKHYLTRKHSLKNDSKRVRAKIF